MSKRIKNILKYSLFIGLAVLLLWLAFRNTDPQKLISDLKTANYWWVLLAILMGYSAVMSRGYRWLILLEPMGYKPKLWNSIHSVAVLYIVNLAVPRAGEIARCTSLNQVENIPVDKLFGTVIVERLVDLLMFGAIVGFTFLIYLKELLEFINIASGADTTSDGTTSYIKYYALAALFFGGLILFLLRKKIKNHPKFSIVRNFFVGVKEGLLSVKKMRRKRAFILHTVYIWAMYFGMIYVSFFALASTAHLGLNHALFLMVAASLGVLIPVPGGIGAYHFLVMMALGILGISNSDGLAYATIVHSSQTLQLLLGGIIGFIGLYLQRKKSAVKPA